MSRQTAVQEALIQPIHLTAIREYIVEALEREDERGVADSVDLMISQAAYHGASDLHLEPWTEFAVLRYRIDGILQEIALVPRSFHTKIVARIKVLADLIVYRRDVPQDGRIDGEKTSCGRPLRVSTVPTIRGENTVIRLLGDTQELYSVDVLGFQPHVIEAIRDSITRSQGALLLTGPSSSGKTTTIYALLREIMHQRKNATNIVTIEDPVEYTMDKVVQIQVNPHVDFTFATALRSILRQDPEVIMVGEIRDFETARMAIQSGLTGHYMISTIHSGTAAGVFTRLIDMGIEPFLVSSAITGVLAQRLVRLNCPECTQPYEPNPALLEQFDGIGPNENFFRGQGCEVCEGIGYRSRAALGEMITMSTQLSEFVLTRPTTAAMQHAAVALGMETLTDDGLSKARRGITSIEELVRVLPCQGN